MPAAAWTGPPAPPVAPKVTELFASVDGAVQILQGAGVEEGGLAECHWLAPWPVGLGLS